jgi:transposase-like protein
MGDKDKSIKTTAEQEKITADKLAFNNAAIEALKKNAAERDKLRIKNKEIASESYARRRANRDAGSSGRTRLIGLSTLNRPFQGDGLSS